MNLNRIEMIRRRLSNSRFVPPISISSVYYIEDVEFLLHTIDELTNDSNGNVEKPKQTELGGEGR
jgi:hypothetical protein